MESSVRCKVFSENRSAPTIREAFMRVKLSSNKITLGLALLFLKVVLSLGMFVSKYRANVVKMGTMKKEERNWVEGTSSGDQSEVAFKCILVVV